MNTDINVIQWITQQVETNEFFQGGMFLAALGYVGYMCRRLPYMIFGGIKRMVLVTVSFDERESLYQLFQSWVHNADLMKSKRDVMLKINERTDPPRIQAVPDRKSYYVRINGIRCRLSKGRDDTGIAGGGKEADSLALAMAPDRFWITCAIWNRQKLLDTLADIVKAQGIGADGMVPVYTCSYGWWCERYKIPIRTEATYSLREGQFEEVCADLDKFLTTREWYEERQIPYQRGYLLCGPPGTGKTTLATILGSKFKMRLCVLDLANVENDKELKSALIGLPGRALVVIEDFDSYFKGRENIIPDSKITFSGLLNAINGVVSSPGRVLILTTNMTTEVDPALMRAGRVDKVIKLDYLDDWQALQITTKFQPETGFWEKVQFCADISKREVSPADLVQYLQTEPERLDQDALVELREHRRSVEPPPPPPPSKDEPSVGEAKS